MVGPFRRHWPPFPPRPRPSAPDLCPRPVRGGTPRRCLRSGGGGSGTPTKVKSARRPPPPLPAFLPHHLQPSVTALEAELGALAKVGAVPKSVPPSPLLGRR